MLRTITVTLLFAIVVGIASPLTGQKGDVPRAELRVENRPKIAGKLDLHLRDAQKVSA